MANVLDTLQILIEADSSGLQSQLKMAGGKITNFIKEASSKPIDWNKVFSTSALSFAASGVGVLFSTMVARSIAFQSALMSAGAQSQTFNNSMGALGDSALSASNQTGISATDIASALEIAVQTLQNMSVAQVATNDAAQLASHGVGNLTDNVVMFSNILKTLGVTSAEDAATKLNQLYTAAKNSGLSFSDFASIIEQSIPGLKDKVDFSTAVSSLAAFSAQSGITADVARSMFEKIATAMSDPMSEFRLMATATIPGFAKALNDKSILGAITSIESAMKGNTTTASVMAQTIGLSTKEFQEMGKVGNKSISDVIKLYEQLDPKIKSTTGDLKGQIDSNTSAVNILKQAWATFENTLTSGAGGEILKELAQGVLAAAQGFQSLVGSVGTLGYKTGEAYYSLPKGAQSAIGGVFKNVFENSPFAMMPNIFSLFTSLVNGSGQLNTTPSSGKTTNISSVINVSAPQGGEQLVAQNIASELYKQSQGIK